MSICSSPQEMKIARVLSRFQNKRPLNVQEAQQVVEALNDIHRGDAFEARDIARSLASAVSVQDNIMSKYNGAHLRTLPLRDATPQALKIFENFAHRYGVEFNYRPASNDKPDFSRRINAQGKVFLNKADIRVWQKRGEDPNPVLRKEPAPNFKSSRPPFSPDPSGGCAELIGDYPATSSDHSGSPLQTSQQSGQEVDGYEGSG